MHLLLYNSLLQKVCLTDSVTYLLFVFRLHQNVPRPGMVLSSHEMSHLWDSSQISSHFFLIFLHFLSLLSETKWHSWYSLPSLEHLSLHSSRSWHGDVDALGGGGDGLGGGGDGGGDCGGAPGHVEIEPDTPVRLMPKVHAEPCTHTFAPLLAKLLCT